MGFTKVEVKRAGRGYNSTVGPKETACLQQDGGMGPCEEASPEPEDWLGYLHLQEECQTFKGHFLRLRGVVDWELSDQ